MTNFTCRDRDTIITLTPHRDHVECHSRRLSDASEAVSSIPKADLSDMVEFLRRSNVETCEPITLTRTRPHAMRMRPQGKGFGIIIDSFDASARNFHQLIQVGVENAHEIGSYLARLLPPQPKGPTPQFGL